MEAVKTYGLPNHPWESAPLSARYCSTRDHAIRLPTNTRFRAGLDFGSDPFRLLWFGNVTRVILQRMIVVCGF